LSVSRSTAVAAKKIGIIGKGVAIIIGHLALSLIILAATKGKTAIKSLGLWLKEKTILFIRWVRPKAIQAGQILKILLVFTAQKLKNKGVSIVKRIAELLKDLSGRLYRKAKEVTGEKVDTLKQDIAAEKTKASETGEEEGSRAALLPSEVILKEEESMNINERLALEIAQNGIKCEAVTDIGSLAIENKSPYSYLFAMSPRIVTNRGCIRLIKENGSRNIDFIQIVQRN
jgi:hypothetical protein